MLNYIIAILCIVAAAFAVFGLHLVMQDNKIRNTVEYQWLEDTEKLVDGDGDIILTYPRHYSDTFLEDWEAEWNRETIRIEFDRLMFLNDIAETSALWQLEIEKGVNISANRTVQPFINES